MSGQGSSLSRRRFLAASPGLVPLLAARPRHAQAQGALKGTKLTVFASNWYVPETNTMLDELAASLSRETGMEVKVERFAGEQQVAKVAAVVGSGSGADIALVRDFDAYLYADKLIDVTDLANEIGTTYGGWYDIAKQACVVKGRWKALYTNFSIRTYVTRSDEETVAALSKKGFLAASASKGVGELPVDDPGSARRPGARGGRGLRRPGGAGRPRRRRRAAPPAGPRPAPGPRPPPPPRTGVGPFRERAGVLAASWISL